MEIRLSYFERITLIKALKMEIKACQLVPFMDDRVRECEALIKRLEGADEADNH